MCDSLSVCCCLRCLYRCGCCRHRQCRFDGFPIRIRHHPGRSLSGKPVCLNYCRSWALIRHSNYHHLAVKSLSRQSPCRSGYLPSPSRRCRGHWQLNCRPAFRRVCWNTCLNRLHRQCRRRCFPSPSHRCPGRCLVTGKSEQLLKR